LYNILKTDAWSGGRAIELEEHKTNIPIKLSRN